MNLKFLAKLQGITSTFFNKIMILQADNNIIFYRINMLDFYEYNEILCNKNLI